jgi:SAM-dependent methyltransferase
MHQECATFVRGCTEVEWDGALVYEVGAYNVNGRCRDIVPQTWETWVGFDLDPGDDVVHVGDAVETMPGLESADVVVSTEVLEHYEGWSDLVGVMCDALRPGGWLLITCAGTGRPPHAADGSPGMPVDEHYRNVTLAEVVEVAGLHDVHKVYGEEGYPGDSRYLGRKAVAGG